MRSANTSTFTLTSVTVDIMNEGCFGDAFDIIACTRYALMSTVMFITAILCVVRIYKLHKVHHAAIHHYIIFYSSTICCIICIVHWILGTHAELDFIAQWFKQLSYLAVTHSFWTRAHTANRSERMTNYCLLPGLIVGLLYCTVTVIYGAVRVTDYDSACYALVWVIMSSAELFIVQTFFLAALFISKRLDAISTVQSVRISQKRKLWGLVIVFEISAVIGFSYDMAMRVLSKGMVTCGDIFNNVQLLYSLVFGTFMIIKFALPIWAMLAAFDAVRAAQVTEDDDSDSLQSSDHTTIAGDSRTVYIPRLLQALRRANSSSPPS